MFRRFLTRLLFFTAFVGITCAVFLPLREVRAADVQPSRDYDLEFGGAGSAPGEFDELRDIAVDAQGQIFTLEGVRWIDKKARKNKGNLRIQCFDASGQPLRQFSISDSTLGDATDPGHLAVDRADHVYITQFAANLIQRFDADGHALADIKVPHPCVIASGYVGGKEAIVVASYASKSKSNAHNELTIIDTSSGELMPTIQLDRRLTNIGAINLDKAGNFYIQADCQQIFKFNSSGTLLKTIGAGTRSNAIDGSELGPTVVIDSKGNIVSTQSSRFIRFDPEIKTVSVHIGQFRWNDAWFDGRGAMILAIDPNDRVYVAATSDHVANKNHFRPFVLRLALDFWSPDNSATSSTESLGLSLNIQTKLPGEIGYQLVQTSADIVIPTAIRHLNRVKLTWAAYDTYKNDVGGGSVDVAMTDGQESRIPILFTPPKWGWYCINAVLRDSDGTLLRTADAYVGFTSKYPQMPDLAASDFAGPSANIARQMFVGQPLVRLQPQPGKLDLFESQLADAQKRGAIVFAQFTWVKDCDLSFIRETVTRFSNRVHYWEIVNEPNLIMSADQYVKLLTPLYTLIKNIDPKSQVMGPAICGIDLYWLNQAYDAGLKNCTDILSLHDYEGNESVDLFHWQQKFAQLHKLMAQYNDDKKPLWQTERGFAVVRGQTLVAPAAAVRVTLHDDILESLGIPLERDYYYYVAQGGYSAFPAYLWSKSGPLPAALASRTRRAMTLNAAYSNCLDFGPTGDKIFFGLKYNGSDGSTLIIRNLGTGDTPLKLKIAGDGPVEVVDAFGNSSSLPVIDGQITLVTSSLPQYVRLKTDQSAICPTIDFGSNLAASAQFSYSSKTLSASGTIENLANGQFGSIYKENPADKFWIGQFDSSPQTLDIRLATPQSVSKMLIFSQRADNQYCALLDYDVEYSENGKWITLSKIRTSIPESNPGKSEAADFDTWYRDENFFVNEFAPITTDHLRLVIWRTTYGLYPDKTARDLAMTKLPAELMLREIEIYGPSTAGQ